MSFVDDLAAELDAAPRPMPDIITFHLKSALAGYRNQVVSVPGHGLWKVEKLLWLKTPSRQFSTNTAQKAEVTIRKVNNLELLAGALSSQDDS